MKNISKRNIKGVYDETRTFLNQNNISYEENLSDFYIPSLILHEDSKTKREVESSVSSYLKSNHLKSSPKFSIKKSKVINDESDSLIKNVIFTLPTSTDYNVGVGESSFTSVKNRFNILFNSHGIVLERKGFENLYGYDSFICDANPLDNSFNILISKNKKYFSILRRNNKRLITLLDGISVIKNSNGVKNVKTNKVYGNDFSFNLEFNTNQDDNLILLNLKLVIDGRDYYIKIVGGKLQAYYFNGDTKINSLNNSDEIKYLYDAFMCEINNALLCDDYSFDILMLKKIMGYIFDMIRDNRYSLSINDLSIKEVSSIERIVLGNIENILDSVFIPYLIDSFNNIRKEFKEKKIYLKSL